MKTADLKKLRYQEQTLFVRGLYAKKNMDGSCSWLFAKKLNGKTVRLKLGTWPDMSIDAAEAKAAQYRTIIEQGINPRDYEKTLAAEEHRADEEDRRKAITLKELHEEYMRSRATYGKGDAPSTIRSSNNTMRSVWEPFWDGPIRDITFERLEDHYHYWTIQRISQKTGKPAVQQMLKACRYLKAELNFAIKNRNYIETNPFDKFSGQISLQASERKYYLLRSEAVEVVDWLGKLITTNNRDTNWLTDNYRSLNDWELSDKSNAIYDLIALEMFTGLRHSELWSLKWNNVHLEKSEYELLDAFGPFFEILLSKQKVPFGIPITTQMDGIFKRRLKAKKADNEYVFPAVRKTGEHVTDDKLGFKTLRKLIDTDKLKRTDTISNNVLRHTFATMTYQIWGSHDKSSQLTGHDSYLKKTGSTKTYVHKQADDHRTNFQTINDILTENYPLPDDWEDDWEDHERNTNAALL
jgi:integrase